MFKDENMIWIRKKTISVHAEQGRDHEQLIERKNKKLQPQLGRGASMRGAHCCQKEKF